MPTHAQQVRSNRDFVRIGDRSDHSCVIVAGMVGRYEQTSEGDRQITAFHIPGDMADLSSVVQPVCTSALQALTVSTILKVPHAAIQAMAERYPAIARALWRDCTVDAGILSEWVVNVGRRDARTRIAHVFCEEATRLKVAPASGDIVFNFPVTQTQLADATGLTAVHVNRTLRALRRENVLTVHGHTAWIHDWEKLADAGEFDPDYLQMDTRPEPRLQFARAS